MSSDAQTLALDVRVVRGPCWFECATQGPTTIAQPRGWPSEGFAPGQARAPLSRQFAGQLRPCAPVRRPLDRLSRSIDFPARRGGSCDPQCAH